MRKVWVLFVMVTLCVPGSANAREWIYIVGSSRVTPIFHEIAERFSDSGTFRAPHIEVTGVGQGFRLFGEGIGFEHPDINVSIRPITKKEYKYCAQRGVGDITEIVIGLDGLAIANSSKSRQYDFSGCQLHAALTANVIQSGRFVKNRVARWSQVDPGLPDAEIKVFGPPPSHPDYDYVLKMIMGYGYDCLPGIETLSAAIRDRRCCNVRTDGAYVPYNKNEFRFISQINRQTGTFGVMPLSTLFNYEGMIAANAFEGVVPTYETISNGKYKLTKPIYVYVKTRHVAVIDGLQKFLYEITAERTIGPDGYLIGQGFFPLDDRGRNHARDMALSLATINP